MGRVRGFGTLVPTGCISSRLQRGPSPPSRDRKPPVSWESSGGLTEAARSQGPRHDMLLLPSDGTSFSSRAPRPQVEFPEARIYEETLNVLLYETPRVPDNSLLEATSRSRSQASPSEDEEAFELRDRVRRIHVKRYSTYDDRQLGHQSSHRD